jgi:hypothetical protein
MLNERSRSAKRGRCIAAGCGLVRPSLGNMELGTPPVAPRAWVGVQLSKNKTALHSLTSSNADE